MPTRYGRGIPSTFAATLRWLDELGFEEAWIGEHHTAPWEPHPAPDLLVDELIAACRERYDVTVEEVRTTEEKVVFKLPRALVA